MKTQKGNAVNHLVSAAVLLLGMSATLCAASDNLALGKPYTCSERPNYALCRDAADKTQLTDGEYVKGHFWTRKGTVGWNLGSAGGMRIVTVDLGRDEPIAGFSWNFAAGIAGVGWPRLINVYVSVDGKVWHCVGDLYAQAKSERGGPQTDTRGYAVYRAWSQGMPCHGRHVAFLVQATGYCFCDELEVYRGDAKLLKRPLPGPDASSPLAHFSRETVKDIFRQDAQNIFDNGGVLPAGIRKEINSFELDFTKPMIEPLADVQRKIFAGNAQVLRKVGFTAPAFRASNRWANHDPLAVPTGTREPETVCVLRRETRATAVDLVNPTETSRTFDVALEGLPAGAHAEVREVLYTRAKDGRRISGALKPGAGNRLTVEVPGGTVKQLWISFVKPDLDAGVYTGRLAARANGVPNAEIVVRLEVAARAFPARPRLHVGGWDYSERGNVYYRSPSNLTAKIARMREMHVDTPWATKRVAPKGAKFDADGNLLNASELDYADWDDWTATWKDMARQYAVFVAGGKEFHGEPLGTPRFMRMVKTYFGAWYAHAVKQGLGDRRFVLLPYDEPSHAKADAQAIPWCRALKAADPRFVIFEDPTHADPTKADPELYAVSDVLCPNMRAFRDGTRAAFFLDQRAKGKELWLYSCSGPSRTFDPLTYYRTQGWYAWRLGAKGSFFWALGCGGGIGDSWRPFAQPGTEYSPFFVSPTDAMASKQSEAIRESAQDYEYLALLSEMVARRKAAGKDVATLEKLLAEAPVRALGETDTSDFSLPYSIDFENGKTGYDWDSERTRPAMDAVRREIFDALKFTD